MIYITGNSFMQIVGIHWDEPHFRTAYLRFNRKGIEILGLDCGVKLLYRADFRGKIITGLSGKNLVIRNFTLKVEKKQHLEQALQFQSETTSHLPPNQILSSALLYENKKDKTTEAVHITALKEDIGKHLHFYSSLEIVPDRIAAIPQALLRYAVWKYPEVEKGFFVDLGSSEWSCIWVEQGRLKRSFSLSKGIEELLFALWEDRKKTLLQKEVEGIGKQIDLLQIKSHLNPHLHAKLIEKRQELAKIIHAFSKQSSICPIFFTGRTDAFVHLREYLLESLHEAVIIDKKLPPLMEEHKYAISIGLALEEKTPYYQSVQFRQDEFFTHKNWKKAGLFITLLLALSMLSSAGALIWNHSTCIHKEQEIIQSMESLLSRCDPSLKAAIFQKGTSTRHAIENWISTIEETDKHPSYTLKVAKVSEVLEWISNHPLLKTFQESGDPILWKEIRYRLIHFPKIGALKEDYKAQIEIEFRTENSTNARKFHETLLKGDLYVDAKQPIGWENSSHDYKVTFFLTKKVLHDF
ncbi:MAG: hypothetical protein K2X08_06830 [Chlamydiales bacterium]|nr:hypothetical protein [Chlamydiales bacterium]